LIIGQDLLMGLTSSAHFTIPISSEHPPSATPLKKTYHSLHVHSSSEGGINDDCEGSDNQSSPNQIISDAEPALNKRKRDKAKEREQPNNSILELPKRQVGMENTHMKSSNNQHLKSPI
jgi:hypothetical protein